MYLAFFQQLNATDSPSVFKGYKNDICLNDKYV